MKNRIRTWIVLAIIFIVYSVAAFALPFHHNAVFWLSYVFSTVAIAAQVYVMHVAFAKEKSVKSKFYGFPVANVGVIYMVIQLALGLLMMALAEVVLVWIPVVLYAALLGAACVGFIAADAMRDEVTRQDERLKQDVSAMRGLQSRIRTLAAQNRESAFAKELEELSETFRFSDPVSSEATADLEADLSAHLDTLLRAAIENDGDSVVSLCKKTRALLDERNRICKLNK